MSSQFKSEQFKKLQAKWHKKLEKKGFDDAEQADGHLKWWASSRGVDTDENGNQLPGNYNLEYYRLAGQFLHEYRFKNKIEAYIWELHSDAFSIRKIVKVLKAKNIKTKSIPEPGVNMGQRVNRLLMRLAKVMLNGTV